MPTHDSLDATVELRRLRNGDRGAVDRLLPAVYGELRRQARCLLRRERPDHTLQPTALVHEAYLRVIDQRSVSWQDRAHFIAFATTVMRRVLTDYARRRAAAKRGGPQANVTLDVTFVGAERREADIMELESALKRLAELGPRRAKVAAYRIIGGLSGDEIAEVLQVSRRTADRDWRTARAWLVAELRPARAG